jgi:hypothetical protein
MVSSSMKLFALAAIAACVVHAGVINLTTPGTIYGGGEYTLGYEFSPSINISVTSLEVYDDGMGVLGSAAMVGIWDTSGDLLTSATVPAGSSANDGYFSSVPITPFSLTAGVDYVVGAYLDANATSYNTGDGGSATVDPNITIIQDMYNDDSSFAFPSITDDFAGGAWLGGSFSYGQVTGVPEPGAFLLAATGLAALLTRRHLRSPRRSGK